MFLVLPIGKKSKPEFLVLSGERQVYKLFLQVLRKDIPQHRFTVLRTKRKTH